MPLTFRQLEVVRAVSRQGSVTAAAGALAISQPAVSMMLRECARAAGFPLFQRRQGRLQPTPETRALLGDLERVFDGVERLNRLVDDIRDTSIGTLRIAATPTLADNILPIAVQAFCAARPRIHIAIQSMDNLGVIDTLARERVDFGLVLTPISQPDARLLELCRADLICIVGESHPLAARDQVSAAEIAAFPLVSFARSLPLGNLVDDWFRAANVPRRIAIEVNQSSLACALVRAGAGVAVVDPFWLLEERRHGLVRLPIADPVSVGAQALIPREAPLSRPARLFLATLRRTATNLLGQAAF